MSKNTAFPRNRCISSIHVNHITEKEVFKLYHMLYKEHGMENWADQLQIMTEEIFVVQWIKHQTSISIPINLRITISSTLHKPNLCHQIPISWSQRSQCAGRRRRIKSGQQIMVPFIGLTYQVSIANAKIGTLCIIYMNQIQKWSPESLLLWSFLHLSVCNLRIHRTLSIRTSNPKFNLSKWK